MSAVSIIERALKSGVLMPGLIFSPDRGASQSELADVGRCVGRPLSGQHKSLLSRWNGANLDILRILGATASAGEIEDVGQATVLITSYVVGLVVFASDPSGFLYVEYEDGRIASYDTKTLNLQVLARNIDDFFERVVFGPDAASFAGQDWAADLRNAGLIL